MPCIAVAVTLLKVSIFKSIPTIILPGLTIFSVLAVSFFGTNTIQSIIKGVNKSIEAKNRIMALYSDSNFPIYEPSSFPSGVGKLISESVYEDKNGATVYLRTYSYEFNGIDVFSIKQVKPKEPVSAIVSLEELRKTAEKNKRENLNGRSKVDYKSLIVDGQSVFLYMIQRKNGDLHRMMYVLYDNMWIEVSVPSQVLHTSGNLSESDLLRLAESLNRTN